jgi:group I intron endonuclease
MFYIYKITNLKNNKIYIGKTNEPERRWNAHKNLADSDQKHYYLHNAMIKHGINNFIFEIILEHENEDIAYNLEASKILELNSNDRKWGYNLTIGGRGVKTNRPVSLETRYKISESLKGKTKNSKKYVPTQETIRKLSRLSKENKGKIPNDIKQDILQLFNSGKYTKEQLAKQFNVTYESVRFIISYHGKNGFKTEEEKTKNRSGSKLGKEQPQWQREKSAKAMIGHPVSDETKKKISEALKGKSPSEESRRRIAIALLETDEYLEIVRQVLELYKTGNYSFNKLGKLFNYSSKSISRMIKKYGDSNG